MFTHKLSEMPTLSSTRPTTYCSLVLVLFLLRSLSFNASFIEEDDNDCLRYKGVDISSLLIVEETIKFKDEEGHYVTHLEVNRLM